jgi:membrane protein DedA with SNARE-associated domain
MMAGCAFAYALGARGSAAAERLVGAPGLARAQAVAARYGDWTIVICRPIPVLAEATAVVAGVVRAPLGRFLALTAAANLGIAAGYAAVGAYAMRVDSFLIAFVGALLIPAMALGVAKMAFRSTGRQKQA